MIIVTIFYSIYFWYQANRLQLVLNSADRTVIKTPKFHDITQILKCLHQLKISDRIKLFQADYELSDAGNTMIQSSDESSSLDVLASVSASGVADVQATNLGNYCLIFFSIQLITLLSNYWWRWETISVP